MTENHNDYNANSSDRTEDRNTPVNRGELRVVLVAEPETLSAYGPVLRRMSVGLMDEVAELTLLCLGDSPLLASVPSPPVRVIREVRQFEAKQDADGSYDTRNIPLLASHYPWLDWLRPNRRMTRLYEAIAGVKPSLLHALSEREWPLVRRLARRLGIPYAVSILSHQPDCRFLPDPKAWMLPCESYTTRILRNAPRTQPDRIHRVPIGTHVTEHVHAFSNDAYMPQCFCSVPMENGHGVSTLLNVAHRLVSKGHWFQLILAGEGPAESEFRQHVNEIGLSEQITFVEPIQSLLSSSDAIKTILSAADIFVQPFVARNWRPELLEAMSLGLAVIAPEKAHDDLVLSGKTALTVPLDDEEALFHAIDALLSNHDKARTLGQLAQGHLHRHFLASHMITRLVSVYSGLLRSRAQQLKQVS